MIVTCISFEVFSIADRLPKQRRQCNVIKLSFVLQQYFHTIE